MNKPPMFVTPNKKEQLAIAGKIDKRLRDYAKKLEKRTRRK